jgi:hypothetical protein
MSREIRLARREGDIDDCGRRGGGTMTVTTVRAVVGKLPVGV